VLNKQFSNGNFSLCLKGTCELSDNFKKLRSEILIAGIDRDAERIFLSDNLYIDWVYSDDTKELVLSTCLLDSYDSLNRCKIVFSLICKAYKVSNMFITAEFMYKDLEDKAILNVIRSAIAHEDMFRLLTGSDDNSMVVGQSDDLKDFIQRNVRVLTFKKLQPYLSNEDGNLYEGKVPLFDLSRTNYDYSFWRVYLGSDLESVPALVCFYSQLIITSVLARKSHSRIKNLPDFEYFRIRLTNLDMTGPAYFSIRQQLYKLFRKGWEVREVKENGQS